MTDYSEIKHTLKRVALNLEMPKQKKTTAFIIKEKKKIYKLSNINYNSFRKILLTKNSAINFVCTVCYCKFHDSLSLKNHLQGKKHTMRIKNFID